MQDLRVRWVIWPAENQSAQFTSDWFPCGSETVVCVTAVCLKESCRKPSPWFTPPSQAAASSGGCVWVSHAHTHTQQFIPSRSLFVPFLPSAQCLRDVFLLTLVFGHVIREPPRPPGAQRHDGPGAAAHQKLSAGRSEDPESGGEAVGPRQRHRLQRLRGAGPPRPGQGEAGLQGDS